MKRKLLVFVLTLCMVGTLVTAFAMAKGPEGTALSGNLGNCTISESGSYYLSGDATGNITIADGKAVTLDLNGYVLNSATKGSAVIKVGQSMDSSATLIINDSNTATEHYFIYSSACAWTLDTSVTEEQKSAAIALKDVNDNTADGTLVRINGGVITGANTTGNYGGIVVLRNSTLEMNGGTVCGNRANEGGGIYTGTQTTIVLENVSIVGNHADKQFGGVLFNGSTNLGACRLTLGGTVNIFANTAGDGNNLILWDSAVAPITIDNDNPLTTDSKISVAFRWGRTAGAFTQNGSADDVSKFISENTGYAIKFVTDHLEIAHEHKWNYELSADKKTVTASCGIAATCEYSGNDNILTIEAPSSAIYDGSGHNASFGTASSFLGGSLPAITYSYKATKDGEYETVSDTVKAGYYKASVTFGEGDGAVTVFVEYEVAKKQLTVTGTSVDGKTYDGTTKATVGILGQLTGVVGGDNVVISSAFAEFSDSKAGNGKNVVVTYVLSGADAWKYEVASSSTTADIEKCGITVTASSATKAYDGTALVCNGYSITTGKLVPGDVLSVTVSGSRITVGSTANNITGYAILRGTEDVTEEYNISIVKGSIAITKADITLISATDEKIYDGTPLTNSNVVVSGAVASGESFVCTATGSQTTVGSSANTFTYEPGETTNPNNYNITTVYGVLTVAEAAPATGDSIVVAIIVAASAVAAIGAAISFRRKKEND